MTLTNTTMTTRVYSFDGLDVSLVKNLKPTHCSTGDFKSPSPNIDDFKPSLICYFCSKMISHFKNLVKINAECIL